MSAESAPSVRQSRVREPVPWLHARELWGGVSLVVAWLAVLFVGIFGGNIETADAGGGASSVPVVVVVAIAALLATASIGRWAFRQPPVDDDLRKTVEDQRRMLEELTAQVADLRATARRAGD